MNSILEDNADPNEMLCYASSHLGLPCLSIRIPSHNDPTPSLGLGYNTRFITIIIIFVRMGLPKPIDRNKIGILHYIFEVTGRHFQIMVFFCPWRLFIS